MPTDQNRAFHYAVLASIVLHALVLFGVSQGERPRLTETEPAIVARLIEPPAPPPAAQAQEPATVKPRPRAKPRTPKPPAREARPALSEPAAASAPVEEPPVAETPASPEPAPVEPPVLARVDPAPAAPSPPAAVRAESPTPDPGSLAQYRLKLISAARNYKRYPRVAIDNNWEGNVVVRMSVGANGRLSELTIQSSSGHAVLDQQALEMFRKASAVVQIPPALRGKPFAVELRAIYNLRDQDSG